MRHSGGVSTRVTEAVERNRTRVWALCYRMTGNRADADDLSQEAIARGLEKAAQMSAADATAWLLQLATRVCLDHLRRAKVRRRLTELVDPIGELEWVLADEAVENELLLREDVRFAIIVALQRLSPRQRAAIILRDVCGLSLAEVATALGSNSNAVKALLLRARTALVAARGPATVDVPVDEALVRRFADAIQAGSIEDLTALLAEEVWGIVDGGGVVVTASKPTFGRRAVSKQWANAKNKLGVPVVVELRRVNGEASLLICLAHAPDLAVALVHVESRGGRVAAVRTLRDPVRLARFLQVAAER
jgi:RNA polymerase sigma-70 factor, ECF subfamily